MMIYMAVSQSLGSVQINSYCSECALFSTDVSVTLQSIPEDLSAAGENNGEYLKMAKKGGRKGTCCVCSLRCQNKIKTNFCFFSFT